MRENARRLLRITSGTTSERFENDEVLRLAAERLLQHIGEAARAISSEFQASHPEIPWRKIIGQRNVLVHEYGEIKPELIWQRSLTISKSLCSSSIR